MPRGSMQAWREDRSEETGGKPTPLNVMETTAWFCQPSPPLHPACLLLFFSLSGYKMSQGLGPNLPWVLWLTPCSSLEVTLESSSVPSKPGVSCKADRSGNRTLETPGTGRCGALLSPFMSKSFEMSWPGDQLVSPLEEGCSAHRASGLCQGSGAGARAGEDAQAEPRLQTLRSFLRSPGGSGRCSQTQAHETWCPGRLARAMLAR